MVSKMTHTCYHIFADGKNVFKTTIYDVKETIKDWKKEGESNIRVFKIITEDLNSDAILLNEEVVPLSEIEAN